MFLGNSKLCTAKGHLSAIPDTVCILGRKDYFKAHRLVLKIQYFWIEKSFQIVYVSFAECDSNNFVWSLANFPALLPETSRVDFAILEKQECWLWKWWCDGLGTCERWSESISQHERDLILRVPIEDPIEVIDNFWNRSLLVSCYFMSWLFVMWRTNVVSCAFVFVVKAMRIEWLKLFLYIFSLWRNFILN